MYTIMNCKQQGKNSTNLCSDGTEKEKIILMEKFMQSHSKGHFLQMPYWGKVKECWEWRGILVYEGADVVGAMSVLIRKLPLGMSVLYTPRGPVCDRNNKEVMGELLSAVKEIAKDNNALLFLLDPDEPDANQEFRKIMKALGFQEKTSDGFGNFQPQHVFRLELAGHTEEEIFAAFHRKTRYNIRLAKKHQVEIRHFDGEEGVPEETLGAFSQLMEITGKRDDFLVRGKSYFEKIFDALGKDAVLFMAYLDQQPIAGTIGIYCGQKAWYLYGASANEHRNVMPNYLLQWEMIRYALHLGCSVYDFRGVPGNVPEHHPLYGLYRFKKGFSGEYIKFTGLFTYYFKPILSRLCLWGYKCYRYFYKYYVDKKIEKIVKK